MTTSIMHQRGLLSMLCFCGRSNSIIRDARVERAALLTLTPSIRVMCTTCIFSFAAFLASTLESQPSNALYRQLLCSR